MHTPGGLGAWGPQGCLRYIDVELHRLGIGSCKQHLTCTPQIELRIQRCGVFGCWVIQVAQEVKQIRYKCSNALNKA